MGSTPHNWTAKKKKKIDNLHTSTTDNIESCLTTTTSAIPHAAEKLPTLGDRIFLEELVDSGNGDVLGDDEDVSVRTDGFL